MAACYELRAASDPSGKLLGIYTEPHPLESAFDVYLSNDSDTEVIPFGTLRTVEDAIGFLKYMADIQNFIVGTLIYFSKSDPARAAPVSKKTFDVYWEHPTNRKDRGGRLMTSFDTTKSDTIDIVTNLYFEMFGTMFSTPAVTAITFKICKGNRLRYSVWMRNKEDTDSIVTLGQYLAAEHGGLTIFEFQDHSEKFNVYRHVFKVAK